MKVEFVDGVPDPNKRWNIRRVEHKGCIVSSNGTFAPKGSTDFEYKKDKVVVTSREENHITVVRQPTRLKTAFILFHETCHWLVHVIFGRWLKVKRWLHRKIDKYL